MRNFRSNCATSSCPHKPLEVPKCEEKLTIHLLLLNPAIMVNVMRKLGKKTERMATLAHLAFSVKRSLSERFCHILLHFWNPQTETN